MSSAKNNVLYGRITEIADKPDGYIRVDCTDVPEGSGHLKTHIFSPCHFSSPYVLGSNVKLTWTVGAASFGWSPEVISSSTEDLNKLAILQLIKPE